MGKTKKEAADFLGVSVRTIESYTAQGKLSVTYARGKRGQIAQFDDEELARLKAELETPSYPQRPAIQGSSEKLTTRPNGASMTLGQLDPLAFVERLSSVLQEQKHRVSLADKLTLDLAEAAELSGLSEWRLRSDARSGKLKYISGGRGYRV